ncbi:MAG TPA: class I SAM-dependent methyltransferase [Candidatus Hydrogenedentes bacterium]|nr:class I SAM-dependent methyltransferase [Candidatus Hydrogenedentota bacterium]
MTRKIQITLNNGPLMGHSHGDQGIAEFFDHCARKRLMYEFEPVELETLQRFLEMWAIRPGMRVLEPGCGAGRLTAVLAEAVGPEGEVVAYDLSPEMVRLAEGRGLPAQVHLICGSASAIVNEPGGFDRVICLNVFPHFADQAAALRGFSRLLKPEGQLWINHFEGRESLNHFHHHAAPEVSDHTLPCPYTMRRLMEENGFELLDLVDQPDAYWAKAIVRQCES